MVKTNNEKTMDIAKKCIVRIDNYSVIGKTLNPFDNNDELSHGTGFFITKEYLLTNHHVVKNAVKLYINVLGIEEPMEAKILWLQKELDFAVLKLKDQEKYKPEIFFEIGDSSKLKIKDKISVIGYPLGGYYNGLKGYDGIVSGWEENKIQHDTNTNPGMSGSPILFKNQVVGLHKEGYASESIPGNIMFGATINSLNLHRLLNSDLPYGYVHIPKFPFATQNITSVMNQYFSKKYKLPKNISNGVLVYNSLCNEIMNGDIILSMDDFAISNLGMIDFHKNKECLMRYNFLCQYKYSGDIVNVSVLRLSDNYSYTILSLKISMIGPKVGKKIKPNDKKKSDVFILGDIVIHNINDKIFAELDETYKDGIKNHEIYGVLVSHIFPYSLTEKDGILEVGTIISHINGIEVHNVLDVKRILKESEPIKVNNFIELRTVDNMFYVLQKSDLLDSATSNFSKWKIPNDKFYTHQSIIWLKK